MNNLLSKGFLLLIVKLMTAGLAFAFHVMLARQLSIEDFGLFNLALTCLVFSCAIAKQGIDTAIIRYFAQQSNEKIPSLYLYVLMYSLGNITVASILLFILAPFISTTLLSTTKLIELFPCIIGLTFSQILLGLNSNVLKGRNFPLSSLLFTGAITFVVAVILLLLYNPTTVLQALQLFFYSVTIAALLSFIVVHKRLKLILIPVYSKQETKFSAFVNTSRVLFFSSVSALLAQQFAILILAKYSSLADVAIFSVALKISLLMGYPLIVLNTITAPKYAKMYAVGDINAFKQLAWLTTKVLAVIATLVIVFIVFFVENLVSLFGGEYLSAAPILIILAIGQWFNLATGSVVSMLIMSGFEKTHRRNAILISLFTIVAMYVGVPKYGIVAAAWITTITMVAFNLLSLYFVNRFIYSKTCGYQDKQ